MERRLGLDLDAFGWEALEEEARRQGVTVERLVEHAALYYLADLDSGRVAKRVLHATRDDQEP
jgi:hypothetical protein